MSRPGYYSRLLRGAAYSVAKGAALPIVRREAVRSGAHGMVYPITTYSPWLTDEPFQRTFAQIRRNTLVDEWRCYELWSLLGELSDVPGAVLEVGVWRGGTGALMAKRCQELGVTDPVLLCDTWTGIVKTTEVDTYYEDGKHDDSSKATVEELVRRLGVQDRVRLLEGIFPDDTGHEAEGLDFRLVHIDVDVYQSARDVFEWAWSRLASGGVVVFDDYGGPATLGVARFVDEQRGMADRLVIHNLNGHALIVKR